MTHGPRNTPENQAPATPSGAKDALRRLMMDRRAVLAPEAVRDMSRRAQQRVLDLPAWRDAGVVLLYAAFRNETSTDILLQAAWDAGKRALLPRCVPGRAGVMDLAEPRCLGELKPGAYGILEPDPYLCPSAEDCRLDLAVTPGVAFDRTGHRLGYGGGYFDRFLAGPMRQGVLCLGLAYGFQVVDRLPADPWDQPVDCICTEEESWWIRR